VANGEAQEDTSVNAQTELTYSKGIEMFSESIPSSVLQTYAVLQAKEVDRAALFSILSSVSAIAFAGATISLDHDIDPVKRINSPDFYVSFIATATSIKLHKISNHLLTYNIHVFLSILSFLINRAIHQTRTEC